MLVTGDIVMNKADGEFGKVIGRERRNSELFVLVRLDSGEKCWLKDNDQRRFVI